MILLTEVKDESSSKSSLAFAGFPSSFLQILKPVKYRVPVDFLRDWQAELNVVIPDEDKFKLCQESVKYLSGEYHSNFPVEDRAWSEAVIYVTLHSLCGRDIVWMDGLPGITLENGIIPEKLVLEKILVLYNLWKNPAEFYPCARPYAFCMLIEAALKIKDYRNMQDQSDPVFDYLKDGAFSDIADYYNLAMTGAGEKNNELTIFVDKYAESGSPLGVVDGNRYDLDHFKKMDLGRVNIKEKKNRSLPLTILVAGLTGSGKTYLIKELYFGNLKSYYLPTPFIDLSVVKVPGSLGSEIESYTRSNRPAPNVADCFELESTFKVGNDPSYKLSMIDTRGGLLGETPWTYMKDIEIPEFERNLTNTDLLLLVIDPETLFEKDSTEYYSQVVGGLSARLNVLFKKSQHAMIGIVFSKFDEYGLLVSGNRRLIHNSIQADAFLEYQKQKGNADAWNNLLETINNDFPGDRLMKETLREIMEKIKGLINNIVLGREHTVFNIYITSAQRPSSNSTAFYRTGIPMIFDDFEKYIDWLINAPLPAKIISAKHIRKNGVELIWNNPRQETGNFVLLKKPVGGNATKVGEFAQAGNSEKSRYNDTNIENGKLYTYLVARNETSEEKVEVKVLTFPDKVTNIVVKHIPVDDTHRTPGIELSWQKLPCDYEVQYAISRIEENPKKGIHQRRQSLMGDLRSEKYNDYRDLKSGSTYSYEIVATSVEDNSISSEPALSQEITQTPPLPPWPLIIILCVIAIVLAFIIFS